MEYDKELQINRLGDDTRKEFKDVIVDFIVYNPDDKKIIIQKRAQSRTLFPGAWEFPGGHLEPHETLVECIKRLLYEEAQMHLHSVLGLVHKFTWDSNHDVANLQFLVDASGTFTPNKDKISDFKWIDIKDIHVLLEQKQETPIYRGAFYAFEYIEMLSADKDSSFEDVLFFDQIIANFFQFIRSGATPPKVVLGKENEKKFKLDKDEGVLSIAPSFLKHYDRFGCASIILHLVFHNYRQNILTFEDVKAIRGVLGKNFMFYVDIVADVYTFLFFERYYGFTETDYQKLCYRLIQEYQAETVDGSKLSRLLGSDLTIKCRRGQGFDVVLPALSEAGELHVLRFNRLLSYQQVALDKDLHKRCINLVTDKKLSEKEFLSTLKKVGSLFKLNKIEETIWS